MTCENCLMFTHCRYDLERNGKPCENFKDNKARENIIAKLKYHRDCWEALATTDNLFMLGKIEAMDMAIRIVNAEFDKAEKEVEGK